MGSSRDAQNDGQTCEMLGRDVGSQDIVDKAAEIARDIEEHRRAAGPPDAIVCSADAHTRNPVDSRTRNPLGVRASGKDAAPAEAKEPAWQTMCQAQRSQWKSLGWPFHDEHPFAAAEFAGMTRTPREREVLEGRLLQRCARFGMSPRDADEGLTLASAHTCPGGPLCTHTVPAGTVVHSHGPSVAMAIVPLSGRPGGGGEASIRASVCVCVCVCVCALHVCVCVCVCALHVCRRRLWRRWWQKQQQRLLVLVSTTSTTSHKSY